jgi:cold-inducible RNA-binding protein
MAAAATHGSRPCIKKEQYMQIFVGNLAFTATEVEVRELFEAYGVVERVQIMTDRETGRPRGFGFVEMPDATEAQAAIAGVNGTSLGGRPLNVNEARPREERGGPQRGQRRPRY